MNKDLLLIEQEESKLPDATSRGIGDNYEKAIVKE